MLHKKLLKNQLLQRTTELFFLQECYINKNMLLLSVKYTFNGPSTALKYMLFPQIATETSEHAAMLLWKHFRLTNNNIYYLQRQRGLFTVYSIPPQRGRGAAGHRAEASAKLTLGGAGLNDSFTLTDVIIWVTSIPEEGNSCSVSGPPGSSSV